MKRLSNSKLVYIPSEVVIHSDTSPSQVKKLEEPKVLLVLDESDIVYEVLYEGIPWVVKKNKTYLIKN